MNFCLDRISQQIFIFVELFKIKLFNTFAGILFFGVRHQKIELASSIILERVYLTSLKLLTIFYFWVKLNG